MPDFNEPGISGGVIGNRSTEKVGKTYVFSSDGAEWTNLQVLEYLLTYHGRDDIIVNISGTLGLLENIVTVNRLDGRTLYQAINELIPRQRGAAWSLVEEDPNSASSTPLIVKVWSLIDTDIKIDENITIPANVELKTIDLPVSNLLEEAVIQRTTSETYNTVMSRGGFIKTCFNLSHADDTFYFSFRFNFSFNLSHTKRSTR